MKQAAVPDNSREQVVEIVSDAAGEPAHRLHFLGLTKVLLAPLQGLLCHFAFGDVVHRQQYHFEMIDAAAPDHQAAASHNGKILFDFKVGERVAALQKSME